MRLIDADALIEEIESLPEKYFYSNNIIRSLIKSSPTINARRIIYGTWLDQKTNEEIPVEYDSKYGIYYAKRTSNGLICSVCGSYLDASDEYTVEGAFCPHCGSQMYKEE